MEKTKWDSIRKKITKGSGFTVARYEIDDDFHNPYGASYVYDAGHYVEKHYDLEGRSITFRIEKDERPNDELPR